MNVRSRLIAGLVFLVLGMAAIVFVWQGLPGSGDDESLDDAFPTPAPALFPEAENGAVTGVEVVDREMGETFAAHTDDGQTWTITEAPSGADLSLGADSARLINAVISLPALTPTRTLTDVEGLAEYGLDAPRYVLTYHTAPDGGDHTLYIGSPNPTGASYYARLTDDPASDEAVHLLSSYSLDPVLAFTSDPPVLLPTPTPADGEGEGGG